MKLGIISDCVHYKNAEGLIGTENHILLRQFQELATFFSATTVACPFGRMSEEKVISWYDSSIKFIELPVVGGETLKSKLAFLPVFPKWIKAFRAISRQSDIVYQRFPNNLNIPGFFYFYFKQKKVFATYTGTWANHENEALTYRFQRWLLKKLFRGPVWVYATQVSQDGRIRPGISPSYSRAEWDEESERVYEKITSIKKNGLPVFRLISVGTLIAYKNQLAILKACVILVKQNFSFRLILVGDGPSKEELKDFIKQNNLGEHVELVGKKNYQELRELYRHSDFVVQAPLKEGFGKVPVEGMFHGVIPVLNNISLAASMTGREERGFLFDASDVQNLADKLLEIKNKISSLPAMIENGRLFTQQQTLESWANEYHDKVSEFYKKS